MDKKKIFIIVILALVVVLYIVFVVNGSSSRQSDKTTADSYTPSDTMKNFGSIMGDWLGRFLPDTGIPCPLPPPKDSEFKCDALAVDSGGITVPAKKGTYVRIATLVLKEGKARVDYEDETDAADKADMDDQGFDLPDMDHKGAKKSAIVIFEKGGTLKISCQGNAKCQVALK